MTKYRWTQAITLASAGILVNSAAAQTGPGLLLDPMPEDVDFNHTSSALIFETGNTGNGFGVSMDIFENRGRVRIPGDEDFVLRRAQARIGYEYTHIYLDTADPALPKNLVDTSVGFGMGIFQSQDETIVAGITLGVGYAGAGAFGDSNAYYGLADLAIGKEFLNDGRFFKAGDRVGFVLNYDGNRTLFPDIPIPGFQYTRPITEELELSVGFPFSAVTWRPDDRWEFRLNYSVPDSFTGRVDYGLRDGIGIFAEVAGQSEAFHSDSLPNGSDRILFSQTRAEVGVRYRVQETLNYSVNAILAGGYAFEHEFNVGFDIRNDENLANLSDEPYIRAALELRF